MMTKLQTLLYLTLITLPLPAVQATGEEPAARSLMMDWNRDPEEADVESPVVEDSEVEESSETPTCKVNATGFYGSAGIHSTRIGITYQLEFDQSVESSMDVILAPLERAIVDRVLPTLFSDTCDRSRQLRRRLAVVGASVNPSDMEIPQVTCPVAYMSSHTCAVIDGQMTVYSDDRFFDQTDAILEKIEQAMGNGDFNEGVHSAIVNVAYLELSSEGFQNDGSEGPVSAAPQDRGGLAPPFFVVIAVGSLAVIVAAIVWRRRKNEDNTSVLSNDTSTEQECTGNDTTNVTSTEQEVSIMDNSAALDFAPVQM